MNKEHPLAYILRMRKPKKEDIDSAFDLICFSNWTEGRHNNPLPVVESREAWEKLKTFLNR